jgi:hypothetical protein
LWVVIGYSGSGATTVYYSTISTDGINWTNTTNNISSIFTSTGWVNALQFGYDNAGTGIFLAVGAGNGGYNLPSVAISQNGINWKTGGNAFPSRFGNNCYYGNGFWVAVGNTNNAGNCVVYSSNISYAGNANITWATAGTFYNPAYGVVYTGTKWIIGTAGSTLWTSATNLPNSSYTSITNYSPQFPGAIMTNKGNIAVIGGNGTNVGYLYYRNLATAANYSAVAATNAPTYVGQIEYIPSSTMWVAAMGGTVEGNNSIAISTTAKLVPEAASITAPWTNIQSVNVNIPVCDGVAAAK